MRPLIALAALCVVLASCRDTTVPSQPGQPRLTGRVVVLEPGTGRRLPAKKVFVEVLRTNLSALTNDDGRFTVGPLPHRSGTLSLRLDADGDGRYERQSLLDIAVLAAGGVGDIIAGELVLSENAYVRGRAVLGDKNPLDPAHGGIAVYIPETPYLTQTTDIGAYLLRDLPQGAVTLAAAKDGYAAQGVANVHLEPGQVLDLKDLVLDKAASTAPGTLTGRARRMDGSGAGITVKLVSSGGDPADPANVKATGSTGNDGSWTLANVAPGLYDLDFGVSGYQDGHLYNVLAPPAVTFDTGEVWLAAGQESGSGIGKTGPGLGNNHPPSIVVRPAKAVAGEVVQLDASATTDPDGDAPLKFTWTQSAPPLVDPRPNDSDLAAKTTFTAPASGGSVKLTLRVADPLGAYSEVPVVVPVNARPVAKLLSSVVVRPGTLVTVDGTQSFDPDSAPQPLSYQWTVLSDGAPDGGYPASGDGGAPPVTLSSTTTPTVSFWAPPAQFAQVRLQLVVSDGELASDPAEILVYAAGAGVAIANAGADQDADFGGTVLLNPVLSSVPPGSFPSYYWTVVSPLPCAGAKINGVDAFGRSQDATNGTATYTAPNGPCDELIQLRITASGSPDAIDTLKVHVHDLNPVTVDLAGSYPPPGATNAFAFGPVKVRFARPVSYTSLAGTVVVSAPDGGVVAGTTAFDNADQSVSFVPEYPFDPGSSMNVAVSGFTTTDGRGFADGGPYGFSFSSAAPALQPTTKPQSMASLSAGRAIAPITVNGQHDRNLSDLNGSGGTNAIRLYGSAWWDVSGNWALDDITPPVNRIRGEEVGGYSNGFPYFARVGGDFTTSYGCPNGNASRTQWLRAEPDTASKSWSNWWLVNTDVGKNASTTAYPGSNCNSVRWTSPAIDGDQGLLIATVEQTAPAADGGPQPLQTRLWRCASCVATKIVTFPIPPTDWVELPSPMTGPTSTEVLTGISVDASNGAYAMVWVSETATGKKLRGSTFDPVSRAWTDIPGQNGADLNPSGDAQYPTVRWFGADLVIGYYHQESTTTAIRLYRYSPAAPSGSRWTYMGSAPLSTATPEPERLSIAVLQKTVWASWTEPSGPARQPHVKWWDPRSNQWIAPTGAAPDGTVTLGPSCWGGRPFLSRTYDGAGMSATYPEVCPTTPPGSIWLRDVR